ncbi:MAG: hypothetical protein DRJ52_09295 [Thermoprotei archaeon]|nr:MAG: hypothetical protein DRJ52_09295 [Thermoprotei archaeon]
MNMNRRGQFFLLAALLLSFLLLLSLAAYRMYSPEPKVYIKRDWIQQAQLVQLARVWVKSDFCILCIRQTSLLLKQLNQTYRLNIPTLTNSTFRDRVLLNTTGYANYTVVFYYSRGSVRVMVYWSYTFQGFYEKKISPTESVVYKNYTLTYYHVYVGGWGSVTVYPSLKDPLEKADLRYLGGGEWIVGFPSNMTSYTLFDQFEIPVRIGG